MTEIEELDVLIHLSHFLGLRTMMTEKMSMKQISEKRRKIRRIKIKTIKTVKIRKKTETKTGIKSGIGRRIAGRIGDGIFGMKEKDIVKKIWKELRQKEFLSDIRKALAL